LCGINNHDDELLMEKMCFDGEWDEAEGRRRERARVKQKD